MQKVKPIQNYKELPMNIGKGLDLPILEIYYIFIQYGNGDTDDHISRIISSAAQQEGVNVLDIKSDTDIEQWARSHVYGVFDQEIQGISNNIFELRNVEQTGVLPLLLFDGFPPELIEHINSLFGQDVKDDWFRNFARDTHLFIDDEDGSVLVNYQLQRYKGVIIDYINNQKSAMSVGILVNLRDICRRDEFKGNESIQGMLKQIDQYLGSIDTEGFGIFDDINDLCGADAMPVGNCIYNPPAID